MPETDTASWLPKVGDRVDRYEVIAPISRGGMAAVYAVRRRSIGGFGKLLAMKVLLPHLREERQFVDMFLDEARIASSIQHPNVVQVFDLGEQQGTPFLVMELVRGLSLSELVKRARASETELPPGVALHVLSEVAEGLHAAHETTGADGKPLGIVHRDITPHNILVSYEGHAKVSDFGIAAARGRISTTRSGEVRGKLSYLAPEQIQRLHALDRRVDIWSLGVVAWEVLSGARLFEAGDEAAVLWEIVSGKRLELTAPFELPESVVAMVRACLDRDRSGRPGTCREVAEVFAEGARALGCRGNADVERFIADLCPDSEIRLDRELSDPPDGSATADLGGALPSEVGEQTGTDVGVSASFRVPRAPGRSWRAAGIVALLAAVGGALAFALRPTSEPIVERAEPATLPEAKPAPNASQPKPAETKRSIRLGVAPRVTRVLVANSVHAERPVELELGEDETIDVELVLSTGKIIRQRVGIADDGATLGAIEKPVRTAPAPPRNNPLMGSPY